MKNGDTGRFRFAASVAILAVGAVVFAARSESVSTERSGGVQRKPRTELQLRPSHATHIRFVSTCEKCKGGCADCHVLNEEDGKYELNEPFCDTCHLHYQPSAWKLPGKSRPLDKIRFDHNEHKVRKNSAEMECSECHEATMRDNHKDKEPLAAPEDCFSCHKKEKVTLPIKSCGKCHEAQNRQKIEPPSHTPSWLYSHGETAAWSPLLGHGEQCSQCHGATACVACHRRMPPRSHTGLWRERLHGTEAKWDRRPCKTCHETGACVSCHRRTPPVSHRGDWIANHGRVSGFEAGCATCHAAGWCRDCHSGGR